MEEVTQKTFEYITNNPEIFGLSSLLVALVLGLITIPMVQSISFKSKYKSGPTKYDKFFDFIPREEPVSRLQCGCGSTFENRNDWQEHVKKGKCNFLKKKALI